MTATSDINTTPENNSKAVRNMTIGLNSFFMGVIPVTTAYFIGAHYYEADAQERLEKSINSTQNDLRVIDRLEMTGVQTLSIVPEKNTVQISATNQKYIPSDSWENVSVKDLRAETQQKLDKLQHSPPLYNAGDFIAPALETSLAFLGVFVVLNGMRQMAWRYKNLPRDMGLPLAPDLARYLVNKDGLTQDTRNVWQKIFPSKDNAPKNQ